MCEHQVPKCPYCGKAMTLIFDPYDQDSEYTPDDYAYQCVGGCIATSPVAKTPEDALTNALQRHIDSNTSDGYHTFNELYDHRAKLFSVIVRNYASQCWKSKLHHDGTMYEGMFIVGIDTPGGQASYHYDIDPYWDMFDCKELPNAPEWDGHTPQQAIERIRSLPVKMTRVLKLSEIINREEPFWVEYREDWFPKDYFIAKAEMEIAAMSGLLPECVQQEIAEKIDSLKREHKEE